MDPPEPFTCPSQRGGGKFDVCGGEGMGGGGGVQGREYRSLFIFQSLEGGKAGCGFSACKDNKGGKGRMFV